MTERRTSGSSYVVGSVARTMSKEARSIFLVCWEWSVTYELGTSTLRLMRRSCRSAANGLSDAKIWRTSFLARLRLPLWMMVSLLLRLPVRDKVSCISRPYRPKIADHIGQIWRSSEAPQYKECLKTIESLVTAQSVRHQQTLTLSTTGSTSRHCQCRSGHAVATSWICSAMVAIEMAVDEMAVDELEMMTMAKTEKYELTGRL